MTRPLVCLRRLAPLLLLLVACEDPPAGPEPPEAQEPTVIETARFVIVDSTGQTGALLDRLGARLEMEYDSVGAMLPEFDPPPIPVVFILRPGFSVPFVVTDANRIHQFEEAIAIEYIPHHLAHLYTRYARSTFIEEGLAVYVNEVRAQPGERPDPFRGQPTHAWTALYDEHGSAISLFTLLRAENVRYEPEGSSADASAWQLFVQAGSFTRWVIETHGRDQWFEFYLTANLGGVLGDDTPAIQRAWFDAAAAAYPDPLTCEEALAPVGAREEFWCARARGE